MIRDDAATDGKRAAGDVGAGRVDAAAATETPSDDSGPREHGGHDLGFAGTDPTAVTPGGEAGGGKFAPSGPALDSQAPPAPADVVNVRENTEGGGAGGTGGGCPRCGATDHLVCILGDAGGNVPRPANTDELRRAAIEKVLRDMGYVPMTWIYFDAVCDQCDQMIFSERFRPAIERNWSGVTEHWLQQVKAHKCP